MHTLIRVLYLLIFAGYVIVVAVLINGRRSWRHVALAAGTAMVALPWLAPTERPGLRAILGVAALWVLARLYEFARAPGSMSIGRRIWCLTAPFDAALSRPISVRPPVGLLRIAGYATVAGLGLVLSLRVAGDLSGAPHLALRWLGALVGFYAGVEAVTRSLSSLHALAGIETPPIQDTPILATSVAEFWSRRWNRPVSRWLRRHCFLPMARRQHALSGVLFAFLASAVLHFYFVWVSVGMAMALSMASFFLIQPLLLLIERTVLRDLVAGPLGRVWTIAALATTSPLFLEPMLRITEAAVPLPAP